MANQTYQLVITGNCCGQFVQNIFHYRMDDDSFANRLLSAKGLVDGWLAATLNDYFIGSLPQEYILKSVKCRRVTNGGGPEWIDTSLDGSTGGLGDNCTTPSTGPTIIWFTDGGPRRVGKTFLSGIGRAQQGGGEITSAALTTLDSNAEDFRQPFPAVGGTNPTCTFCIPRSTDLSIRSLVVGHAVSKDIGLQRRRQLPV